jgi:hypothetical protein
MQWNAEDFRANKHYQPFEPLFHVNTQPDNEPPFPGWKENH